MAVILHASYCSSIDCCPRIYGLRFKKISDTQHHYIFKSSRYNDIPLHEFLPIVELDYYNQNHGLSFETEIKYKNEQYFVIVYTIRKCDYNLKIEVRDELLLYLFR